MKRSLEIFEEMYWEAKRAPAEDVRLVRSAYFREKAKKRQGRTKEERDQFKQWAHQKYLEGKKKFEISEIEKDEQNKKDSDAKKEL